MKGRQTVASFIFNVISLFKPLRMSRADDDSESRMQRLARTYVIAALQLNKREPPQHVAVSRAETLITFRS